ncbi:MAG TPA: ferritin-like domain-containing protein [Dehalococcoidia bacterium]|nr:ferritin-like domain-containing protein [Dehalococcoidia bacterium]
MGEVGREVIDLNIEELIEDLNRGVAAELNDAYRYLLVANTISGPYASQLSSMFAEMSQHEWSHLGLLMQRIQQLGGRPMSRASSAEQYSYAPYKPLPEDMTDIRTILEDSLEAERAAIRYWEALYEKTTHADPVTADIARSALADEVVDEDNLERFLEGWR